MKNEMLFTADEVLESFVSHVAKVAKIEDADVLRRVAELFAEGAHRVAQIEVEYQYDGAPFGVADELAEYLEQ